MKRLRQSISDAPATAPGRGLVPWLSAGAVVLLLAGPADAQSRTRARVDERHLKNSPSLLEAVGGVSAEASGSTARILSEGKPVALGTIVRADGFLLTKASELQEGFEVELPDGQRLGGTIVGVLKEHDLAAVKVEASGLEPVVFSTSAVNSAGSGQWLCSPGVGSEGVLAVGNLSVEGLRRIPGSGSLLGVMLAPAQAGIPIHSVDAGGAAKRAGLQPGDLILRLNGAPVGTMRDFVRVLRNGPPDATYELRISRAGEQATCRLTLIGGQAGLTLTTEAFGVPVSGVNLGTGAAEAGIMTGDVITALNDRPVQDQPTLMRLIRQHKPGDRVEVTFLRAGEEMTVEARLGYHTGRSIRGEIQNQLGSLLSARAVDFPAVLQHDSILNANQMGGPLVDLNGHVLGINIARAGRVETFALPAQVIEASIPQLLSGRLPTATAPAVTETGRPPEQTDLGDE